jgi:hypothetical protein
VSDLVIGVGVLSEPEPGKELLTVLCRSDERRVLDTARIRVHRSGAPCGWDDGKPVWQYEERGDTLTVTPSLHILYGDEPNQRTAFHNEGRWSVKFARAARPSDKGDVLSGRVVFEQLNKELRDEVRRQFGVG